MKAICWACGGPGRPAAEDDAGWSWVPPEGRTWYHCDCGVSWSAGDGRD